MRPCQQHTLLLGGNGRWIAAAGFGLVNWATMAKIAASWVISPVFGGCVAAIILFFIQIKSTMRKTKDCRPKWVPVLIGLMAGAFSAYMAMKGLKGLEAVCCGNNHLLCLRRCNLLDSINSVYKKT